MSRFKRLAKEAIWIILGQAIAVFGAITLVRILTEYLTPDEYGQLALSLTVAGFVNQVLIGGISNGIGRYYPIAAEKHALRSYLYATRSLLGYVTAAIVVLSLILIGSLYWLGYSKLIGLVASVLVLSVLTGYSTTLNGIQNAARQRAIVALHSGLDAWLKIGLAITFVFLLGNSSTSVVVGYIFSSLLITVSQLFFLRRIVPSAPNPIPNYQHWAQQMWNFAMPFTIFGGFTWMQQVSDRWALQTFSTTTEVGQYAVLFQLGYTPIALIASLVVSFFGPIFYQRSGDATDHARNSSVRQISLRITQVSLFVTLLGFVIAYAFHEWLFGLLVAGEYRTSSQLLPWFVFAGGLFATGQMLALKLMSEMKLSVLTIAKVVTALVGILLNIAGAALAGMQGVIGALVAFSFIYLSWMLILSYSSSAANKLEA